MTAARIRLIVAAAAFLGWMSWLGSAVLQRGSVPLVSRAQVTGASLVLVANVSVGGDGLPVPTAKVVEVVSGNGPAVGNEIEVTNLPAAQPPGGAGFSGAGEYLLPLVPNADGKTFRVAGLPRSPGYEASTPERPLIYPWTDDVRKQLR